MNNVSFIEEYFMLTSTNWKLEVTWTFVLKSRIAHFPWLKSCINHVAIRCRKYLDISHVQTGCLNFELVAGDLTGQSVLF